MFERYQGFIIYGNGKKYFPDFIKDGEIIEIKGYHVPSVDDKVRAVQKLGKKISVLYKDDLAAQFTWFKSNFPNKKLEECYDDFSPKFKYVCPICSIEFYRNKKGRSPKTFCSRTCSAKNANMVLYAGAAPALLP